MNQISCRKRGDIRFDRESHYVNLGFTEVDGEVKLLPVDPVAPSLANEYSVSMNAMKRENSKPRSRRLNVDAVDLIGEVSKIK